MRKLGWMLVVALIAAPFVGARAEEPKHSIKEVMAKCMKPGGLCGKVAGGSATDEEKAQLLDYFKALAAGKPKKGEAESWKAKTEALVAAAQAAVDGSAEAGAKLKAAANCMGCHSAHK